MYTIESVVPGVIFLRIASASAYFKVLAVAYNIKAGELLLCAIKRHAVNGKIPAVQQHKDLAFQMSSGRISDNLEVPAVLKREIVGQTNQHGWQQEPFPRYIIQRLYECLPGDLGCIHVAIVLQMHICHPCGTGCNWCRQQEYAYQEPEEFHIRDSNMPW